MAESTLIPTFIINGFLDSGKTTFILDTVKNDGFYKNGNTLLLVFEEGDVEYDEKELAKYNTHVAYFYSPSEVTYEVISELCESFHPLRVVIEDNAMWDKEALVIPKFLTVGQIVSFIDFTTFGIYYNNMRQKFVDNLRFSDLVVINRCDNPEDMSKYQTSLKMINNNAQFVCMASDGQVSPAFEDPLPYDIDAPVIQVSDNDFARWYIDTFDHKERYDGKVVEFSGMCVKSGKLPKYSCILGRQAMTCCSKDIQLYGHLCYFPSNYKIKNKSWVHVTCEMKYEYSKEYEEDELILTVTKFEEIKAPANPVLDLT